MKATWKPREADAGSDAVVLGDNTRNTRGPGSKLIISARPAFTAQAQAAAYPRAETVETFARGNIATGIAITVLYEFRSFGECTRFTFDLANYVPTPGILEIAHLGGGASTMQAVCTGAEALSQDGCTAVVQYNFTGGRFTKGQSTNL